MARTHLLSNAATCGVALGLLVLSGLAHPLRAEPASPIAAPVRQAIAEGACDTALNLAERRIEEAPDDLVAYRLLGDAQRCLGLTRDAVLSYREARELGLADPNLDLVIESEAAKLATLPIIVEGREDGAALVLRVVIDGQRSEPYALSGRQLLLTDLPPGRSLGIELSGPGYSTTSVEAGSLVVGENVPLELKTSYLGFATLAVAVWPESLRVQVLEGGVRREVEIGEVSVSAGEVVLTVSGDFGETKRCLLLTDGQRLEIDVASMAPGQLTLTQVPAGSEVLVETPGGELAGQTSVAWQDGQPDASLGINLGAVAQVRGLTTGNYRYRVQHPLLGAVDDEVFVVGGEVTGQPVDWTAMPGIGELRGAYSHHLSLVEAAERGSPSTRRGWVASGATAALLAGTAALTVQAIDQQTHARSLQEQYDAALSIGDSLAAQGYFDQLHAAERQAKVLWAGTGVAGVASVLGVGVSFRFFRKARGERPEMPVWNPATLELGAE